MLQVSLTLSTPTLWFFALCAVLVPSWAAAYEHPFDVPWLKPVLSECRLQCPSTSNPLVRNGEFDGVTVDNHFYLVDNTTLAIGMDKDLGGRCELRHNPEWSTESSTEIAMTGTVKIEPNNIEDFTFFQIHAKTYTPYQKGPLLRMVWTANRYDILDHIWVNVRLNLDETSKQNRYYDLGPRPDGFFDAEISAYGGLLQIWLNDELQLERNIDYWAPIQTNFFKTGTYLHGDLNGPQIVQYKELSMVTPESNVPRTPTTPPTPAPTTVSISPTTTVPTPATTPPSTTVSTNAPTPLPLLFVALSNDVDRSTYVPIGGGTVSGDIYVFIQATPEIDLSIDTVNFSIDGNLAKREGRAPWDLGGTNSTTEAPLPFDASILSLGSHIMSTAIVFATGGGAVTLEDTFIVEQEASALPSSSPSIVPTVVPSSLPTSMPIMPATPLPTASPVTAAPAIAVAPTVPPTHAPTRGTLRPSNAPIVATVFPTFDSNVTMVFPTTGPTAPSSTTGATAPPTAEIVDRTIPPKPKLPVQRLMFLTLRSLHRHWSAAFQSLLF
jgi:hypothetical protein